MRADRLVQLHQRSGAVEVAVYEAEGARLSVGIQQQGDLRNAPLVDGTAFFADVLIGECTAFVVGVPGSELVLDVVADEVTRVTLVLPPVRPEGVDDGAIDVIVFDHAGIAVADASVTLLDEDHAWLADTVTRAGGLASFEELDPGTYGIVVGDAPEQAGLAVRPGERTSAVVVLPKADSKPKPEPKPGPEPKPEPDDAPVEHGTLLVTGLFDDGTPAIGLQVLVAQPGRVIVKRVVFDATANATARDVPAGPCRVWIDGFEERGVNLDLPASQSVPVLLVIPVPP